MSTRKITVVAVLAVLFLVGVVTENNVLAKESELRPGLRKTTVEENKIVLEYEFERPKHRKKDGADLFEIEGLRLHERAGVPIIPVRHVRVLVPFGKKVESVNSVILTSEEFPKTYKLACGQKAYPLSYQGVIEKTKPDAKIYAQKTPWPGIYHKESSTQSKRGYHIFLLKLFPLQYTPSEGKVSFAEKIRLEVNLTDSDKEPVVRPTKSLKKSLERTTDNPVSIGTYTSKSTLSATSMKEAESAAISVKGKDLPGSGVLMGFMSGGGSLNSDGNCPYYGVYDTSDTEAYKYIVITSETFADTNNINDPNYSFQELCDSKWEKGISACIVTTDWIYENYDPNDYDPNNYDPNDPNEGNPTRIRMFLIDAYNEWGSEYVLLGGTAEVNNPIVPMRYFHIKFESGKKYIPCDMYYGCVEPNGCTFNYDEDANYGESNDGVDGGEVDLFAELYVGRAAVESPNEVMNFVKKTLEYDPNHPDALYVTMAGEKLDDLTYGKEHLEQVRAIFDDCKQWDFIDTSYYLYDKDEVWDANQLRDFMNGDPNGDANIPPKTPFVFNHVGHGMPQEMSSGKDFDVDFIKSELENTDYFFVYSWCCHAGSTDENDCFAEEITTMEDGAFAVVMNSEPGTYNWASTEGYNQKHLLSFWNNVLIKGTYDKQKQELGRANQYSKEDNVEEIDDGRMRLCYYELTLFGDPEIRVLGDLPNIHNVTQDTWYWEGTIQEALDDANNGDEIVLAPGTYYERVDFNGVNCTLRSADPNDWDVVAATIIDANSPTLYYAITLNDSEDSNCILAGLTIRNGYKGIYCNGSSPVIKNCIIKDNEIGMGCASSSSPTIINNKIFDNNDIGAHLAGGSPEIINNWIYSNNKGILMIAGASPVIRNNTIVDNTSYGITEGIGTQNPTISNCIIWGHDGNDLHNDFSATYSCIEDCNDANGTGNICGDANDPNFVDANNNDYHLRTDSPCIDAGDTDPNIDYSGQIDIDGDARRADSNGTVNDSSVVDMGADEVYCPVWNITQKTGYPTIQAAIDDSTEDDVVMVYPRTYYGQINLNGKAITLRSTDPNNWDRVEATILDVNEAPSAILAHSGEDANTILQGFMITKGYLGVYCEESSSPIIRNCIIEDNNHGIYCKTSSEPTIQYNKILVNSQSGIYCSHSTSPVIKNNWICNNNKGIFIERGGAATIRNNTIVDNTTYGISGIGDNSIVSNCIIWGHDSNDLGSTFSATYSCIQDPNDASGTGNICGDANDPNFVNADANDFHLNKTSPCLDGGDPNGDYDSNETDIDGENRDQGNEVDMGADEITICYTDSNDYDEWVSVGLPDCWCYLRQCHGDADNARGDANDPNDPNDYWVQQDDLDILSIGWYKPDSDPNFDIFICADFDHQSHTAKGSPEHRVGTPDLQILCAYWKLPDANVPGDCLD